MQPGLPHAACESLVAFVKDRPGIGRTANWYLDNAAWIARIPSGGYSQAPLGLTSSR